MNKLIYGKNETQGITAVEVENNILSLYGNSGLIEEILVWIDDNL